MSHTIEKGTTIELSPEKAVFFYSGSLIFLQKGTAIEQIEKLAILRIFMKLKSLFLAQKGTIKREPLHGWRAFQ